MALGVEVLVREELEEDCAREERRRGSAQADSQGDGEVRRTVSEVDDEEDDGDAARHLEDAVLLDLGGLVVGKGGVVAGGEENRCARCRENPSGVHGLQDVQEGDAPMTEMTRSDELSCAAVSLKPCSWNLMPPAKKHLQKTAASACGAM